MKDIFELTQSPNSWRKYKQKNGYSCGYYCARAIINSLGDGNDKNLKPLLRMSHDGVRQNALIRTLRARKVGVSIHYNLTLARMEHILSQGKYIIVYDHGKDHWMVLGGVRGNQMRFYDPENRVHYDSSDKMFDALGNFGIVCSAKGQ